jgi:hypothetical protein
MKLIVTVITLLIALNLQAQSDTCSYQYRIGIKEITTIGSAKLVQESLQDLFQTKPIYQELLRTFIFQSKINVDTFEVRQALTSTGYTEVTYFKKEIVK